MWGFGLVLSSQGYASAPEEMKDRSNRWRTPTEASMVEPMHSARQEDAEDRIGTRSPMLLGLSMTWTWKLPTKPKRSMPLLQRRSSMPSAQTEPRLLASTSQMSDAGQGEIDRDASSREYEDPPESTNSAVKIDSVLVNQALIVNMRILFSSIC